MDDILLELLEIRKNPRKMQSKYLSKYMSYLDEHSPTIWKIKERIDYVLQEVKTVCHCGCPAKPNSMWCCIKCRNKDSNIRDNISIKNKANKITRASVMKKTLQARYGVDAVQKIQGVSQKTFNTKQKYYENVILDTFAKYKVDYETYSDHSFLEQICVDSSYSELSEKHFNRMPPMTIYRFFERVGFTPKFNKSSSKGERELAHFISVELGFDINENDRSQIKKRELDIYIPEKRLAIEYHGLFWHKDKDHVEKMDLCSAANISLIQIFEDEWQFKPDIVRSIIRHKLGKTERSVFARKLTVRRVDSKTARNFLDRTHIQGKINGSHYGLHLNETLFAIMSVGKNRFGSGHELLRYSTELNTSVVGGFSKLLKHVKEIMNLDTLTTYADLRFSRGDVYEKCGTYSHTTKAGYYWADIKKNARLNRFATQKHKLSKLLGSDFNQTLTESDNMINSGYVKIFDAGHNVYVI